MTADPTRSRPAELLRMVRDVPLRTLVRSLVPANFHDIWQRRRLVHRYGFRHLAREATQSLVDSSFGVDCRLGDRLIIRDCTIGDYSYIERGSTISGVHMGRFCSIGPNVTIGLPSHPTRGFVSTHPFFYSPRPEFGYPPDRRYFDGRPRTVVGSDVWVGAGANVRAGVTIGHGAVVGAGSVVTKDIEPYEIYGGVPARRIRSRFEPDVTEFLLEARWWDRDLSWIREHWRDFHDVEALRRALASAGS